MLRGWSYRGGCATTGLALIYLKQPLQGPAGFWLFPDHCFASRRPFGSSDEGHGFEMMNSQTVICSQAWVISLDVHGTSVQLDCLVAQVLPKFEILLGMDVVGELGGVRVGSNGVVVFGVSGGSTKLAATGSAALASSTETSGR